MVPIPQTVIIKLTILPNLHHVPRLYQHSSWTQRDLNEARYVYLWADGIYSNVRQDGRL